MEDAGARLPRVRPPLSAGAAKPFVKWAGGKGQLLSALFRLLPAEFAGRAPETYAEPFVGGGAMLFAMLAAFPGIRRVIVSDVNPRLVNVYRVIRDREPTLEAMLAGFQADYSSIGDEAGRKAYYLRRRAELNASAADAIESAALFIFLNRTCFNGLYRENASGGFNVPFGRNANPTICDARTLRADSEALRRVESVLCGDFEGIAAAGLGRGAFLYFDPPYRPLSATSSFNAYSRGGFGDGEQKRLAAFCRKLDAAGCRWMLSNSDPEGKDPADHFFRELYAGYDIRKVLAARMVNANPAKRGKLTELVIRNYRNECDN